MLSAFACLLAAATLLHLYTNSNAELKACFSYDRLIVQRL
jgi:hypothetical protein